MSSDGTATASMVLGILSLTLVFILAGIPAIVLGHIWRAKVRKSGGRLPGDGKAVAGLTMGYISLVLSTFILAIAIPNLMRSKQAANQAAAAATVRTLIGVQTLYSTTFPSAGYAPDLATLGPGGPRCLGEPTRVNACMIDSQLGCPSGKTAQWCVKDDYKYSIFGIGVLKPSTDFVITATPLDSSAGQTNYCASSDGVVRWSGGPPLVESIQTVAECNAWPPL